MTPHISTTLLRTQSDERLVRLAAEGHERAFEAIVDRYRSPLNRFAQRFVGEARAEEVVQNAFLNAWNSLRSGTEVRDLKPWLYRIVNNGAINALQRADYGDAPLIEAGDTRLGPEAAFEQSEELRLTVEGIGELPERQREALLAVAVDGRAHADVARDLGVSDAGVRQLVRRARVQLRAAATAITPIPLAAWIAKGGFLSGAGATAAGGTAAGSAAAGGSSAGAAAGTAAGGAAFGGAVKAGAIVASMAVVATGGTEVVKKVEEKDSNKIPVAGVSSARPGERTLIPGADPTMMAGEGRVRVVTAPDGSQRMMVDAPGSAGAYTMAVGTPEGGDGSSPVPGVPGPGGPASGRRTYPVAGVFSQPSIPAIPAPGKGKTPPGTSSGPSEVAEVPKKAGGLGSAPGNGKSVKGGKSKSGTGNGSGKGVGAPGREAPDSGRGDGGGGGGGSDAGKPDKPTSAPVTTTPKADRPDRTDSGDSGKGGSDSGKGGSDSGKGGSDSGKGGRSTAGEDSAPAKGGSGSDKGGSGSDKGGSGSGKAGGKEKGS